MDGPPQRIIASRPTDRNVCKKQQIRSLDFIGAAPGDTKPEMFTAGARLWDRAHPARDSFAAPVVPGTLAGWAALHDQYATMSWPQLLAPATEYAEKGFVVTPAVREGFEAADFGAAVGRYPYGGSLAKRFAEFFHANGGLLTVNLC